MDDLVQFLQARLTEDEQVARDATPGPWGPSGKSVIDGDDIEFMEAPRRDAEHIARHDPARVLREVEAKRRIIDWHGGQRNDQTPWGDPVVICHCGYDLPCSTLRLLALPYADHPDYQEAWRP